MMVRNGGVGTVQARKSLRPAACAIRAPELKGKKKQEKERIPHQSGHAPENPVLERNIVVRDRTCRGAGRGAGRSSSLRGSGTTRAAAFACAAQHDHVSRTNLRGLAFVAFLVVPFTRLKAAFDVDQTAFCQVLVADLGQTIPRHDAVPLGAFLALAGSFIVPYVIGGHREPAERDSACGVLEFRIAAEPPDENYFVNGLRHTDSCCTASALARTPRSRLQFFKLHFCTFSFTRIRKFFHNSFQSLDCLRCLIQFGEGEAFLVKGSTSFIVPGILLQEQIVVRYRLVVLLLVPERIGYSQLSIRRTRVISKFRNEILKLADG